jgi:hypothetical protein
MHAPKANSCSTFLAAHTQVSNVTLHCLNVAGNGLHCDGAKKVAEMLQVLVVGQTPEFDICVGLFVSCNHGS